MLMVGSLFSGIGGMDLGLEQAGLKVAWQVEADPYARNILRKHWPDVPLHHDVRHVGASCLAPVDIIAGGFPCQDISVAGKQEGIDGEKSGLWREFARIIGQLRPRFVIIENVPQLQHLGLGTVLRNLAAFGFDAEWDCFPASAFGAPHRRKRLLIVAHARGQRLEKSKRPRTAKGPAVERSGNDASVGPVRLLRRCLLPDSLLAFDTVCVPQQGKLAYRPIRGRAPPWETFAPVLRVVDGPANRVDRIRCTGNAVVPAVAAYIGRCVAEYASECPG